MELKLYSHFDVIQAPRPPEGGVIFLKQSSPFRELEGLISRD